MDRVAEQITELARQRPGAVVGIGIGSPGKVDSSRGVVSNAVNLGWTEVNLTDEVSRRIDGHLPVWIQKDTNLSALGENYFGACQDCSDFIYLGVGSGLGAGIVSAGHLITGDDWYAADIGHLSIDPNGLVCVCGGRGCAETIASGPGLVRVMQQMLDDPAAESTLLNEVDLTPTVILAAAAEGDALAREALAEVGRALGIVTSACVVILNPRRLVIGGGLGLAGFDFIVPAVREELKRRTIPESRSRLDIVPSRVESPAIGAACLVWYAQSGKMMKTE